MIQGIASLYNWRYPRHMLQLFAAEDYHVWAFLQRYWHTKAFTEVAAKRAVPRWAVLATCGGMLATLLAAAAYFLAWREQTMPAGLAFAAALVIGYPVLWAHLVTVPVLVWRILHPKALGKAFLVAVMSRQVRRLRRRHTFKLIAVAGSVGKTSTKIAIAKLLAASSRVRWQEGNYNDPVTVPLIFFSQQEPSIFNVAAWCKILYQNSRMIRRPYPFDYVVAELGTDTPGTIPSYAYMQPDLAVVTAVTPEHMAFFGTLDGVAAEELSVVSYAKQTLINTDDTPSKYLKDLAYTSYGLSDKATYQVTKQKSKGLAGQQLTFKLAKTHAMEATLPLLGQHGAKIALAAVAAAHLLDVPAEAIAKGVPAIAAFAGRMQVLHGIKNSTIIDDTYNSSPAAAKAALDVLYAGDAPQRIALLGSMNEMGDYSQEAHEEVGAYCDPKKIDLLITLGPDANKYLAPVAKQRGCAVTAFDNPHAAGEFIKEQLQDGAVILAKGSQNRVFAEEALKPLLANAGDVQKLVRQSPYWMKIKAKQFGR
ncbi:MAG TPA: Mur ligase family protein [Candidatus Saccharimonadales bacterium]|nr:Mur ligase family protein [Candidatus Saccharimonadales bacterium]